MTEKAPAPEKGTVQILFKVPPQVKEKAQLQADLAFKYGWTKNPTLVQLFTWVTETLLDGLIRDYIQQRREGRDSPTRVGGANNG